MESAQVPETLGKETVACLNCRLVKTFQQFSDMGCENCPQLGMEGDSERASEFTTMEYIGMMAVIDPKKSWASKWHHLVRVVPGLYAVKIPDTVYDKLSDETRDRLEELKQGE